MAICSCLLPAPRPTLIETSYWLAHVRGSNSTNSPRMRTKRALSWYLHNKCSMPLNKDLTPVSAKIRAISSILPAPACCIEATAAAVTFCNTDGSSPCEASDTPVRFDWMVSRY